ncbi:MAG: hypothetical protein OXG58_08025 [Gemmatimonadetes bacterium]|nr:hypothetical protein [Gemmatimonadota bacterium]
MRTLSWLFAALVSSLSLLSVGFVGASGQGRGAPPPNETHWAALALPGIDTPTVSLGLAEIPVALISRASPLSHAMTHGPPAATLALPDWNRDRLLRFGTLGRVIGYASIPAPSGLAPTGTQRAASPGRLRNDFADLGFSVRGTARLGGDWSSFRPCDEAVQLTCGVPLVPRITPDIVFSATADGTVADRMVVDVDYEQTRSFEGANRINVAYQGRPGEVLQRLEIGDVSFELPPSRFLLEGIPAGAFGFQGEMQIGPVAVSSVWAQQAGEVTTRRFRLGAADEGVLLSDTIVLDDADYLDGQFFFLLDPERIHDYPHIDVLALTPSDSDALDAPGGGPIQLYRSEIDPYAQQQVEGHILADAIAVLGADTVVESAWFRYLQPGRDYLVHPSGLWVALRSPLLADEMLAVTYIAASGDTVGSYNPEVVYSEGGRPTLRLLKASAGRHRPGLPTWRTEMHQVYRVSSAGEVDPASIELSISLGEESAGRTFARRPNGETVTYLRLFGLDEESPRDLLDASHVYRPALESFEDQPPLPGSFIVFPTLEPFAMPAPLGSLEIDSLEVQRLLGENRNHRIYRADDPYEREYGGVFRLNISYEARGDGVVSSLALGAVGIREGKERVTLDDRHLVRGVDYTIEYDIGVITLLDPDALLAAGGKRELEVTWEQRSFVQIAPSSVFGVNAHYDLGDHGEVNAVGLYQTEDRLVRRPRLGVEASAVGLGMASGRLAFDVPALTRLLGAIGGVGEDERSLLSISGEAGISVPNPNTQGTVYLDDFDAANQRPISLQSPQWRLGSRPAHRLGAEDVLPSELSAANLARATWQHVWIVEDPGGDSLGIFEGFHPSSDIDEQIRITGTAVRDPGLFVRFEPDGATQGAAWSSLTTVLSTSGTDLTKSDFIEFYARDSAHLSLVMDLGVVSEDAFFVDATGATEGIKRSGSAWGQGVLDQEANPRRGEVWGTEADEVGVWAEACIAERGRVYQLGDPNANCTRGNGRLDSEDLDNDGNLDTVERYRRFVVELDGSSPFVVRNRGETGTEFRLYRVPLQDASATDVGPAAGDADMRAVRHLRITVVGRTPGTLVLTRMAIVGSTWIRRSETGVLQGIGGDTTTVSGRVEVGPVSRLTVGDAYSSPPGVIEQLDDPGAALAGQGIEFGERSLAIAFEDVADGNRAEVYNRFTQRPRDFMSYQEARLWVVAPVGGFVPELPAYFFLKIGTDDQNFYLYRKPLEGTETPGMATAEEWSPEVVISFEEWLRLRREAEVQLIAQPRRPDDPPLVIWSADSAYAIYMQDRGRAPNLAAVREISVGVANHTRGTITGEVWVDELRLARGIRDAGIVSAFDAEVRGGEFLYARASLRDRSGYFRQLHATPTFQDNRRTDARTTLQLGRLAPDGWGMQLPLTVTWEREDQSPIFLGRSDVRVDRLEVRRPGYEHARADLALWRSGVADEGLWGAVLGGLDVRVGVGSSSLRTITTESEGSTVDGSVAYELLPARRDLTLFPGGVGDLIRRVLPRGVGEKLAGARLQWLPTSVSLRGGFADRELSTWRFDRIVATDADTAVRATEAPRRDAALSVQVVANPLPSLTAEGEMLSGRDLLGVEELADDEGSRRLLDSERRRVAGVDLGWETDRRLRTRVVFEPSVAEWTKTRFEMSTVYRSERNSDLIEVRDTALTLLRNVNGHKRIVATLAIDPAGAVAEREERSWVGVLARGLEVLSLSYESGLISRFEREAVDPGFVYEIGWGGRDDFLLIEGDSASTLHDRELVRIGGGLRLPSAASISVGYEHSRDQKLDSRSDRQDRREVWPDLTLSISNAAPPLLSGFLRSLTLRAGYRREWRSSIFGEGARQNRRREERATPLLLVLRLPRGASVTYRGRFDTSETTDPTGNTNSERTAHSLSASASMPSPIAALSRRGAPMRVALGLAYRDELRCRIQSEAGECAPFVDRFLREASVTVSSQLRDHGIGARLQIVDQRSFVGRQAGVTRFQLEIFGEFLLTPDLLSARSP